MNKRIDKSANRPLISRNTRPISWVTPARKAFKAFPEQVRIKGAEALTYAAEGGKADSAEPMKGQGGGVYEIIQPFRGDTYRVVYTVNLGPDVLVVHAFKKKSKSGIATPKPDIDLIRTRIKRIRESIKWPKKQS